MDQDGKVDRASDQLNKQAPPLPPLSNGRLDSLSTSTAKLFSDGVKVERLAQLAEMFHKES